MNTRKKTLIHFEKDIDNAKKYACFLEKCGFIVKEFVYCEAVDAYRIVFYDPEDGKIMNLKNKIKREMK